jgi:hypothetical protein
MAHDLAKKEFFLVTPLVRLGIEASACLPGFNEHDIPVLVSDELLKPLGHPTAPDSKHFADVEIQSLRTAGQSLRRHRESLAVEKFRPASASQPESQSVAHDVRLN